MTLWKEGTRFLERGPKRKKRRKERKNKRKKEPGPPKQAAEIDGEMARWWRPN